MNEEEDEPLTPEEQARIDEKCRAYAVAWEAEATATFGPPHVRARKNERYVARLVRRHSEETIRGLLKGLSTLDSPTSAADLATRDLDAEPLAAIIRPFELGGFCFRITSVSGSAYTVDFGEGHFEWGSGGKFVLARTGSGTFEVTEEIEQWVA